MRLRLITVLITGLLTISVSAEEATLKLESQEDKLSYVFGQNIGKNLKQQEIEVNTDILVQGMQDALADKTPLLTEEEMSEVLMSYQKDRIAKQAEKQKQAGEKNLQEGKAFLAENKEKEGVVTLESGLQYKVMTPGTGATPKAEDKVTTNYRGTLIDGTEFDSSYSRGKPATFPVKGVIKGWTEALQLMKEGAKWQLFIPSDLAYGERGAGSKIGPNSTLIFEIELLSIEKTEEKKAAAPEAASEKSDAPKDDKATAQEETTPDKDEASASEAATSGTDAASENTATSESEKEDKSAE
jgi:FKBP-type peptidyl-prolyl cis-trans isomerase